MIDGGAGHLQARQRQLAHLAASLDAAEADLGDPSAQAKLRLALRSVSHAVLDLSEGRDSTLHAHALPWPRWGRPSRATGAERADPSAVSPASCSALATELRAISRACAPVPARAVPPCTRESAERFAALVAGAAADLAAALQDFADTTPRSDRSHRQALRGLDRRMERVHRALQSAVDTSPEPESGAPAVRRGDAASSGA